MQGTRKMNAQKYIGILNTHIRHFPPNNYVFQDDNVPVHMARVVEEYKHDNNRQFGMAGPESGN